MPEEKPVPLESHDPVAVFCKPGPLAKRVVEALGPVPVDAFTEPEIFSQRLADSGVGIVVWDDQGDWKNVLPGGGSSGIYERLVLVAPVSALSLGLTSRTGFPRVVWSSELEETLRSVILGMVLGRIWPELKKRLRTDQLQAGPIAAILEVMVDAKPPCRTVKGLGVPATRITSPSWGVTARRLAFSVYALPAIAEASGYSLPQLERCGLASLVTDYARWLKAGVVEIPGAD
ncbi:MAG: hypothetical protein ACE5GJ_10480 [Gemmatimonadota bacterium]